MLSCETKDEKAQQAAALLYILNQNSAGSSSSGTCPTGSLPDGSYLLDQVVSAPGADTSTTYKDPSLATNGICGNASGSGSLDVYSLAASGEGATMVLRIASRIITNGSGIDFVVYENPFSYDSGIFMEPVIVEVSQDNQSYCGFAPDYLASDETVFSSTMADWKNFAGIHPVSLKMDGKTITEAMIFDDTDGDLVPDTGGGDGFDLENLSDSNSFSTGCTTTVRDQIKASGVRYIKLTTAGSRTNPHTSQAFPVHSASDSGPDIDGVIARYTTTD